MKFRALLGLLTSFLLISCGEDDVMQAASVEFAVSVGDAAYACDSTYESLGVDSRNLNPYDVRFYVHDIELRAADGSWVPMLMDADGMWQDGQVALLDFETDCSDMGTAETNTSVTGMMPAGDYDGVRFRIGVPEEINHQNAATAAAPLNLTAMFWNWNGGYKFMRIEADSMDAAGEPSPWRVHLGSTACEGDMAGNATCATPNRPFVELDMSGSLTDGVINFDLAPFVAGSSLVNTPDTALGCMAGPTDPDCAPIFESLGLPFGDNAGGEPVGFSWITR